MLNINEVESTNRVNITGVLSELTVDQKVDSNGNDYASAKVKVKVDQEINGIATQNEVTVSYYSKKFKKDSKEISKIYEKIIAFPETFKSLAACPEDHPEMASKVNITAEIRENMWPDATGKIKPDWQLSANFLNEARKEGYESQARFELSGVVTKIIDEVNENGDPTNRVKVALAVVGYHGKVDVIELIAASSNAANYIKTEWKEGDTVNVNGALSVNHQTKVWFEEQGFGEPIKRTKTESRKELIILGGSPGGLTEEYAYDANDIKNGLVQRQARAEEAKEKAKKGKAGAQTASKPTPFPDF